MGEGMEKKIVLKGASDLIRMAKPLIEEKQCWIKYKEPLFLNYDQDEPEEQTSLQGDQEELKPTGSDNCMEVFVSAISLPGKFCLSDVLVEICMV